MDFNWTPYFGSFWVFPLLCFAFMAVMMLACGRMPFHRGRSAREILDRRYAAGQIGKDEYDAMRRGLSG